MRTAVAGANWRGCDVGGAHWFNGVNKIYDSLPDFTRSGEAVYPTLVPKPGTHPGRFTVDSHIKRPDAKHDNPVVPWRDLMPGHEPVGVLDQSAQ